MKMSKNSDKHFLYNNYIIIMYLPPCRHCISFCDWWLASGEDISEQTPRYPHQFIRSILCYCHYHILLFIWSCEWWSVHLVYSVTIVIPYYYSGKLWRGFWFGEFGQSLNFPIKLAASKAIMFILLVLLLTNIKNDTCAGFQSEVSISISTVFVYHLPPSPGSVSGVTLSPSLLEMGYVSMRTK